MTDEPPLCINCCHCIMDEGETCIRPLSRERSVVNGDLIHRLHSFCWNERHTGKTFFSRRERCGKWGKFFEAKSTREAGTAQQAPAADQ